jgi:hypothetical protein
VAAEVGLQPTCPPLRRPERLLGSGAVHGLRAAQSRLAGAARTLDVWLWRDPPAGLADPARWRLVPPPGGAAVAVTGAAAAAAPTPHIDLALAGAPDLGRYRLEVDPPAAVPFDPLRTWLAVRLRPECPDLDACSDAPAPPALAPPSPVHDYLARDWRSLRQALVEHLLRQDPDADLSIADPTITLIELFAHVGDLLHYHLDRVATEAYLDTARRRTSVKRHARLVDFALGDGSAARAPVLVALAPGAPDVGVLAGDVAADAAGSPLAFTLEGALTARAALGEIPVYDWGEEACCLPAGATECVLVRPRPADGLGDSWLAPGGLLAFEVVDPADRARHASWARRGQDWPTDAAGAARFRPPLPSRAAQVVELTAVEPFADPLLGASLPLALVRWRPEDALVRPYAVGVDTGSGADEVTVARGNLVHAHHGRAFGGPPGAVVALREPDVHGAGPPGLDAWWLLAAAGPGLSLDEAGAPHRLEVDVELPSGATAPAEAVATLLEAPAGGFAVAVDFEADEPPIMRFSTGPVGVAPPLGSSVTATYEVGGGAVGNLPANALAVLERGAVGPDGSIAWEVVDGAAARNPVPAAGGADPMPLDVARRDAPEAFAVEPRRAVLPLDHAEAAARDPLVERAMARREWSGSWPVVATVVDLRVQEPAAAAAARGGLAAALDDVRMLGTEAAVVEGAAIGLLIALDVCARPGTDPESLRREVLALLRPGGDERPGLFHPSRLALGAAVYTSAVQAEVAALPGVDAVEVVEARRLSEPPGTLHPVLTFAPDEVPVLDDDPARPERGRLDVRVRGGR